MTTKETTGGAMMSAVSVTMMYILSIFPSMVYVAALAGGLAVLATKLKWGNKAATLSFFSTAILSWLIIANKEAPLMYTLFMGYYPLLKEQIEKIKSKAVQILLKLAVGNISIFAIYYITTYVLGIPSDMEGILLLSYALGVVTFIAIDVTLARVTLYAKRRFKL